jgi:hypothetical protein
MYRRSNDTFVWLGVTALMLAAPFLLLGLLVFGKFVINDFETDSSWERVVLVVFCSLCAVLAAVWIHRVANRYEDDYQKALRQAARLESDAETWGKIMEASSFDSEVKPPSPPSDPPPNSN